MTTIKSIGISTQIITSISIFDVPTKVSTDRLFSASVPFSMGTAFDTDSLAIIADNGEALEVVYKVTAQWPDSSIKWCALDVILTSKSKKLTGFSIVKKDSANQTSSTALLELDNNQQHILIRALKSNVGICRQTGALLPDVSSSLCLEPELIENGRKLKVEMENIRVNKLAPDNIKPSEVFEINVSGFVKVKGRKLNVTIIYIVRSNYSPIECKVILHNPQAANHENGLWDLGDKGSILIDSLSICSTTQPTTESKLYLNDTTYENVHSFSIEQLSSGGENWQSTSHQLSDGRVHIDYKGYKGRVNDDLLDGDRCQPHFVLNQGAESVSFSIEKFWQNFPSSISLVNNQLKLGLLAKTSYQHELQGGEQKTYTAWINPKTENSNFIFRTRVSPAPSYVAQTQACYLMRQRSNESIENSDLIKEAINGDINFFKKRELIDEYGWRNFGDLFADHETLGTEGAKVQVSHYNNQYDPLYGFLRQYLLSNNEKWWELAEDLARHIKDIDIYHTDEDRDEYNHGLFWHTDHYLDAKTCTHRTFSQLHEAAYDGYTSGGGPGGQHCYSKGLALHFLMTGDESSKLAVLSLAGWIENIYESPVGVISKLFALKRSGKRGYKDLINETYPMDRGTGNYINTLLDSYLVSGNKRFLDKSGNVLSCTFSSVDNITERNFEDIEGTWFYTVLLQAAVRFLLQKEELEEWDQDFYTIKGALLHYSKWMLENEKPYLKSPEKLEFPNSTWTAQDIRKGFVLMAASYFEADRNKSLSYVKAGEEYYCYVESTLATCSTSNTTRILALIMQNHGGRDYFKNRRSKAPDKEAPIKPVKKVNKHIKILSVLLKEVRRLSLKREIKWLAMRSTKVSKLVGNYVK